LSSGKSITTPCYQAIYAGQGGAPESAIDTLVPAIDPRKIMTFNTPLSVTA
jgi:hypothetical protein